MFEAIYQKPLSVFNDIGESPKCMNFVVKSAKEICSLAKMAGRATPSMLKLSKEFGYFSDFVGGTLFLQRCGEWFKGDYNREGTTTYKKMSQEHLFWAHGSQFLLSLHTFKVIDLGSRAADVFHLRNGLYVASGTYSILDSLNERAKIARPDFDPTPEKKFSGMKKYTYWKDLTLEDYRERLDNKRYLLGRNAEQNAERIARADERIQRYQGENAQAVFDEKKAHYINMYNGIKEARNNKHWWNIANNVCKVAMGVIGFAAAYYGLLSIPMFAAAFSVGWIVTNLSGLGKELWAKHNEAKTKPEYYAMA